MKIRCVAYSRLGVPMYAVVGETLGADEFEAKFWKGKVCELQVEPLVSVSHSGSVP